MSRCTACGSEVAEPSRFCGSCGAEAVAPDAMTTRTVTAAAPRSSTPATPVSHVSHASHVRAQGRFLPGTLLGGRYRIVAMLGKGGMGEVYRADDLSLDQPVALKFLPESLALNEDAIARFRNEVRIARQVSHPNVCRVYDMGEMEGQYFLSMEYVDGEDLGSLLRRIGRLPTDKALEIARKLCAGLAAAHERGVLHRDLKPSNVMLDARGQVLLTDFGLAALAEGIDAAEIRNGTPAYMAPEQLAGDEVTVRSDIYALGLVLYEIFTGKLPFESTTLAGLIRAQRESSPVSPATLVRDLDPMVERVILRCLNPKPSLRPASAIAVAAALPGGDPLAAALAAGETPSPEMVAAAGEGEGLAPRTAVLLLVCVLAAMTAAYVLQTRASALAMVQPEFGPEVMAQKSRDALQKLGATAKPADEIWGYSWDDGLFDWFHDHSKPITDWRTVLSGAPALNFWYRSAAAPLTAVMLHDDLLIPGQSRWEDPPPTDSGMARLTLDSAGRLLYYERIPDQRETAGASASPAPDWSPLFALAGLDQSKFKPAGPQWNSLAASDTRAAWMTDAPRSIRVEAAALHGSPVFFARIEPWTKPGRMADSSNSKAALVAFSILATVLVVVCLAAGVLARRNLKQQRGDRRGAFRLAVFVACVEIAVWLARGHFTVSFGTFGIFILAMCTAVFYGVVIWTIYIALEPYARRRWPQTLISWSAMLIGRFRDAVVGRDVLIGCTAGAALVVIEDVAKVWLEHLSGWKPNLDDLTALDGARATLGILAACIPHAIRTGLFFFFLIFLLRVLLRKQWIAGAAFALIFSALSFTATHPLANFSVNFLILSAVAVLFLRWGLLAATITFLLENVTNVPMAGQASAWYVPATVFLFAVPAALALWSFKISLGSRRLFGEDLFG